ncbi:hypothetical protein [Streptomyces sp. NPDC003032]
MSGVEEPEGLLAVASAVDGAAGNGPGEHVELLVGEVEAGGGGVLTQVGVALGASAV